MAKFLIAVPRESTPAKIVQPNAFALEELGNFLCQCKEQHADG